MADIFISYASEDRPRIEPLAKAFEDRGWSVWWDRNLPFGLPFDELIRTELRAARCVVALWTECAANSLYVIGEARDALKLKKLISVFLSLSHAELPYDLQAIHGVELIDWQGDTSNADYQRLVRGITAIVGWPPQKKAKVETEHKVEEEAMKKTDAEAKRKAEKERNRKKLKAEIKTGEPDPAKGKPPEPPSPQKAITNSIGMMFMLIPAGNFTMGSQISPEEVVRRYGGEANWYEKEQPLHPVEITKPFYLQNTEVSQAQWKKVIGGDTPSKFKDCGEDCPVEPVSWNDAQQFIEKLNQMEGINKYRLPTEAEWEYACRAGKKTVFSFGNEVDKLGEYAWYSDNSKRQIHPVGKKKPNAWGLYDMHGNVWEWCQDWYGDYPSSKVVDPKGPNNGKLRVVRGGSWDYYPRNLRSALRDGYDPDDLNNVGFRVARDF